MSSINLFNQGQDDKPLVTTTEVIKRQSDVQSACQLREKWSTAQLSDRTVLQ